jgi:ABC-type transport system involved in multi-copper enzyme maturation permease subunit
VTAFTIARMTLKEASRRRLLFALLVLTVVVIALTAWGFQKLTTITESNGQPLPTSEMRTIASQLLILVMFMFSGVLALSSVFVASPSISGEVESGVALAIVARPIRRADVVLGKWLGLATLIVIYTVGAVVLELVLVFIATGYSPPHPIQLVAYLIGEGLVLMTFALLLSTRMSGMTAGIVAAILFFMAWMGGITGGIGAAFNNDTIEHVGTVSRLLLPTDGLWRGAVFAMEPAAMLAIARAGARQMSGNPFFAAEAPAALYIAWVVAWIGAVLAGTVWSFTRREI